MSQYNIREAKGSDLNFIYDTWLKSYRNSVLASQCGDAVFFSHYRFVIDKLLHDCKPLIACLPNDEDVILGYLVAQAPDTIHYLFVKEAFRQLGIGNALITHQNLSSDPLTLTHISPFCKYIARHKHVYYNPFKLYQTLGETHG